MVGDRVLEVPRHEQREGYDVVAALPEQLLAAAAHRASRRHSRHSARSAGWVDADWSSPAPRGKECVVMSPLLRGKECVVMPTLPTGRGWSVDGVPGVGTDRESVSRSGRSANGCPATSSRVGGCA